MHCTMILLTACIFAAALFLSTDALSGDVIAKCLKSTNILRARHHAGPLVWDEGLAKEAQHYADLLLKRFERTKTAALIHDHRNAAEGWGENLYWSNSPRIGQCADADLAWYTEILDLDSSYNIHKVGHFTQMIWTDTTHVGFGIASVKGVTNKRNYDTFIVAKYTPPGNMYRSGHRTEDFDHHCKKIKPQYQNHLIPKIIDLDPSLCKNFLSYCSKLKKHCSGSLKGVMDQACYPTCHTC